MNSDSTLSSDNAANKVLQASRPLVQFSVLSGCGVVCALAFEKARGIRRKLVAKLVYQELYACMLFQCLTHL